MVTKKITYLWITWGIHRWAADSPDKGPVMRKVFPWNAFLICLESISFLRCHWLNLWIICCVYNMYNQISGTNIYPTILSHHSNKNNGITHPLCLCDSRLWGSSPLIRRSISYQYIFEVLSIFFQSRDVNGTVSYNDVAPVAIGRESAEQQPPCRSLCVGLLVTSWLHGLLPNRYNHGYVFETLHTKSDQALSAGTHSRQTGIGRAVWSN